MKAGRLTTTVFAVALVATACAATPSNSTASAPPPPPVVSTINVDAAFPDDGLTRLIVTPIVGDPSAATTAEMGTGPVRAEGVGSPGPIDPSRILTPGMVTEMPPGAALEARDGKVGYVDGDGAFVPLEQAAIAPTPTTMSESDDEEPESDLLDGPMSYGNPYVDQLATNPAVAGVIVVGDGTFGVTVSDPSIVDSRVFAIREDIPLGITTDQYEPYQWSLENDGTNLDRVTEIAQTADADLDAAPTVGRADGNGVTIAVIDSGVDFSHPDLENSAWSNLDETCGNGMDDDANGYVDDCSGWDFGENDHSPYNVGADPHGTHVSGIITANRDGRGIAGIAPRARIMDLNVASGSGTGMSISGAAVTAAIRYAVDNGADIINMSLGSQPGTPASAVEPMGAAIDYAASKGVLVVVAAGNNSIDLGSLAVYPASFNRQNMIVVGASTPTDTRADFSNHSADVVDVYAPGVLMLSTIPGNSYRFMSGTSQAAPATAAAAALVMETSPQASLELVINAVTSTVDRSDALSTSAVSGRINAASAIGEGDAPPIPTELEVKVSGLTDAANEVSATVEIVTPAAVFDEEYRWELSLLNTTDDGVYAIVDHAFVVDGAAVTTGANGALVLANAEATTVPVATNLPAGRYSFVIEAVPTADTNFRLGDAFVTTFEIAGDEQYDGSTPTTVPAEERSTSTTTPGGSETPASTTPGSLDGDDAGNEAATTTIPGSAGSPTSTRDGSDPDDADSSPTTGGSAQGDAASESAEPGGATPSTTTPVDDSTDTSTPGDAGSNDTDPGGTDADADGTEAGGTDADRTESGGTDGTVPNSPAPVPTGVGSGAAKKGAWESTSVSPQAGYVNQATTVTIRGNFPSSTYVWFGEQPGQVVHQNRSSITVRTPLRAAPGVVDVTLQMSQDGVVLTIPDAYAFVGYDGTIPDGSGDATPTDDTTEPINPDDTTDGGSRDSGSNGDDSSDDSSGEIPADDAGSTSDRRARMTVGAAVELPNGLQGASVLPNLAANVVVCSTDPCTAVRR